ITWALRPKIRLTVKIAAMPTITAIHTHKGTFISTDSSGARETSQHRRSLPHRFRGQLLPIGPRPLPESRPVAPGPRRCRTVLTTPPRVGVLPSTSVQFRTELVP